MPASLLFVPGSAFTRLWSAVPDANPFDIKRLENDKDCTNIHKTYVHIRAAPGSQVSTRSHLQKMLWYALVVRKQKGKFAPYHANPIGSQWHVWKRGYQRSSKHAGVSQQTCYKACMNHYLLRPSLHQILERFCQASSRYYLSTGILFTCRFIDHPSLENARDWRYFKNFQYIPKPVTKPLKDIKEHHAVIAGHRFNSTKHSRDLQGRDKIEMDFPYWIQNMHGDARTCHQPPQASTSLQAAVSSSELLVLQQLDHLFLQAGVEQRLLKKPWGCLGMQIQKMVENAQTYVQYTVEDSRGFDPVGSLLQKMPETSKI